MRHIEIHYCETARDAASLQHAGLPRYDLDPEPCAACKAKTGEIEGRGETVSWRPFGVLLDGETVTVICRKCLTQVDKALSA